MTPFPASCMFDRHLQWNGMSTMNLCLAAMVMCVDRDCLCLSFWDVYSHRRPRPDVRKK